MPTLNLTAVVFATSTTLSVPGTLAFLAARTAVLNVPKPIKLTSLPDTSASLIDSYAASIAFCESFLERPAFSETAWINSAFFIAHSL